MLAFVWYGFATSLSIILHAEIEIVKVLGSAGSLSLCWSGVADALPSHSLESPFKPRFRKAANEAEKLAVQSRYRLRPLVLPLSYERGFTGRS
jgi:hypothetical protein